ncbi:G2/mitotic-specific cyclin-B [Fopius arisanus]|uniref:CCNB protein n=1 Tax=Fopius arisanus TaxID=64838 RepID=A0A0C9RD55_9HYME|nr:PREDICTED: G2/mitotic-specific cyclin-B [Fopius arisanus]
MALRNRTAFTNTVNQENTKNVKSAINAVSGQTRRAALGEIGNRVNTVRGTSNLLPKAQKKPVVKQGPSMKNDKLVEKPPAQVVKPVLKKEIETPIEVKQLEQKLSLHDEIPKMKIDAFSADLLHIEDIDEADKGNPILVTAYSNDIYKYLMELERNFPVQAGYLAGQEVTPKMRSVLIDWLVEVHQQFHLLQETLYLTVAVIDRFLQSFKSINRRRLQLVGVAAMFISCKYEEMFAPDIADFVYITDNAYTKTEILQMEMLIVKTLDYSFGRPLPLHFLRRYSKAGRALPVHHTMAKYFLEQSLVHYEMCHYPPSLIAAAALYLAFFVIGNDDESDKVIWSSTLAYYSTYTKENVLPVVRSVATIIVNADKSKYQAVRKKYFSNKHMKISLRPELKSPNLQLLAYSQ